jgi:trans-aconitate methyltransferase
MKLIACDEIIPLDAEAFEALNARSWRANAALWSAGAIPTPLRTAMLAEVDAAIANELVSARHPLALADLGCGDGGFLRRLRATGYAGQLLGFDLCPELVALAAKACPQASVEVADLSGPLPVEGLAIATCLLTLIEMARYRRAIAGTYDALCGNGLLIVTLLDPTVETIRFLEMKRGQEGTQLFRVDGELVIASSFEAEGQRSPMPYFRFVRPVDQYLDALVSSGFAIQEVHGVQDDCFPFQATPRAVIVLARKQGQPGDAHRGSQEDGWGD